MTTLCSHFGSCGGCAHQDRTAEALGAAKQAQISDALSRHGLAAAEIVPPIRVPERSRRRAALKAQRRGSAVHLGFSARASHDIVDMHQCRVLTPRLFAALGGLRGMMAALLNDGEIAGLHLTETSGGIDLSLDWARKLKPELVATLAGWAGRLKLARVMLGGEIAVLLEAPTVILAGVRIALPPKAFLQPTREGEAALQSLVREGAAKAKRVADLYSGCGTFALALAPFARVHAVESDGEALAALSAGVRYASGLKPVSTEKRDLAKLPLTPPELKGYDAVVLDPPRAGALPQARMLAESDVRRVIYVSCNPLSFARDAQVLVAAGFVPGPVTPVDQFLWSDHVELAATFARR